MLDLHPIQEDHLSLEEMCICPHLSPLLEQITWIFWFNLHSPNKPAFMLEHLQSQFASVCVPFHQ